MTNRFEGFKVNIKLTGNNINSTNKFVLKYPVYEYFKGDKTPPAVRSVRGIIELHFSILTSLPEINRPILSALDLISFIIFECKFSKKNIFTFGSMKSQIPTTCPLRRVVYVAFPERSKI